MGAKGNILRPNGVLQMGDYLQSANGRFILSANMTYGLALFYYDRGDPSNKKIMWVWNSIWAVASGPQSWPLTEKAYVKMLPEGYLVLVDENVQDPSHGEIEKLVIPSLESTVIGKSSASRNSWLILQEDGNLVCYPEIDPSPSTAIWATQTGVPQEARWSMIIPDAINLLVTGELSITFDKMLFNSTESILGVSDQTRSVVIRPGMNCGIKTPGTLAVTSTYYQFTDNLLRGMRDGPEITAIEGPSRTYGPDEEIITVTRDSVCGKFFLV
jgi:hypothetical protein